MPDTDKIVTEYSKAISGIVGLQAILDAKIFKTGNDADINLGAHNLTVDTNTLFVDSVNHRIGIGTVTPSVSFALGNQQARTLKIENTASDVVGRNLTIGAGSTIAGTAVDNVIGGQLILQGGLGTGTGDSSIAFQTGTTLASGKTLQTMSTKMTILGNGKVGIGTTEPDSILHVVTNQNNSADVSILANYGIQIENLNTTINSFAQLQFKSASADGAIRFAVASAAQNDGFMSFLLDSGEKMRLTETGFGIGVTAPTAILHLKACTAAANTASLKINPGVVATTPVSGNIESDGTHLYWTNASGTRLQLDN